MGCGGSKLPNEPLKLTVYGDLFATETRTCLSILKMCEVNTNFVDHERKKEHMKNLGALYPARENEIDVDYMAKVTPVIQHG